LIDQIDQIGPILGLLAFVGLIVLAFLIFGQARDIRRLRDWAGRASERAEEAAEASLAAQEARGADPEVGGAVQGGRLARLRGRIGATRAKSGSAIGSRWAAIDRRLPFDGRLLLGALAVALVAAVVVTGGFGLIGGSDEPAADEAGPGGRGAMVAILNATQTLDSDGAPIAAVPGLAKQVSKQVIRPTDFAPGVRADAPTGAEETVIMYLKPSDEGDAESLAEEVSGSLGEVSTAKMSGEVSEVAGKAPLALVIGREDSGFSRGDESG